MLPAVTVQVLDAYGNLVPTATNQITLALAANPGGSTLGGTLTVAAVNGVATFNTLTLNKVGTGYTLNATATGLAGTTSIAFNITPAAPAQLVFIGQPSTIVAGAIMTPTVTVQVLDAFGNPVPTATNAITLALATNPGGSTLGGTVTVAAINGVASFSTLWLNKVGTGYTLSAWASGLASTTSNPFNVTVGLPSLLAFQVPPSTTVAGVTMTPAVTVQVQDAYGNLVPTATNTISLALATNPGGGVLGGTVTVAAINGTATFNSLVLTIAGNGYTLRASTNGLTGVTSNAFNITPNVPDHLTFLTPPSTTVAGVVIAPAVTVQVLDVYGNLVTTANNSITLALAANPGGSTLGGTVTINAVNGVATFTTLWLNKVGTGYTLSAWANGLPTATSIAFNVTVGLPKQLAFQVQPSTTAAGTTMTPAVTVQVQDAYGNPEPTAANEITLSLATNPGGSSLNGTVTVNAVTGVATFNTLWLNKVGIGYTLSATAAGLTGTTSTAFNIIPGAPAQLAFQGQPSTTIAGFAITPAVSVQVLDANGNLVTTAATPITLALATNPGSSTLSGTLTVNALNGVATFTPLTLNKVGSGYTLSATATALASTTSFPFSIIPGSPARLAFQVQPSTAIAGVIMTPAVTVQVQDAFGNLVPTATNAVTLALTTNPGGSTLGGTVTMSATNGVAMFNTLTLYKTGSGYTLGATASGLTGAASTAFAIAAGLPAQLAFQVQPSTTVVNATMAPAVTVQVMDAFSNLVPTATTQIILALVANPGGSTLNGTLMVNAVNGVATFNTLSLNKVGIGYTLSATPTGELSSATSAAFNVIAGAPSQLIYLQQPSTTVIDTTMTPAVTVQVLDALGNPVTTASTQITLALVANSGGSTLGGTVMVNAVNGVATFSTLTLNKVGTGYTLSATATGLSSAISTSFDVIPGSPAQLAFLVQPSNTAAGVAMAPAVVVQVLDANGNPVPAATNLITLAIATSNPGGSTLGGTVKVNAVNGVATFTTLTLNKVGTGYCLSAWADGLTSATSTAFNITVGPAAQVAFQVQPSSTTAGSAITPAVSVQVLDANGNPEPTATNAITLTLAANPGGGTLGGTLTVNAVNGVATFPNLTVNTAGIGYTLTAVTPGLVGATSTAFTISTALPVLTLTESVSPLNVAPGGIVTYTIAYTNTSGTASATNVTLTDTLPTNASYVTGSASGNGLYSAATNKLTWSLGTLSANGAGQVTFQVTVTTTAPVGSAISNNALMGCTERSSSATSNTVTSTVMSLKLQVSPLSSVTQGQPITLSANVNGGNPPNSLLYKFDAEYADASNNEQVVLIQDYLASSTCTWTPAVAATYTFVVCVREAGETVAYDVDAMVSGYLVNTAVLSGVTVNFTPQSPQPLNTPITLTATALGGTNVQYLFQLYNPATTTWSQLQAYSTSNICLWTASMPGSYLFSVTARDGGTQANALVWFTISGPLTALDVTTSLASPQPPNTSITFTATATGGNNVQFQYWLYNPAATPTWSLLQAYATTATCTWTPAAPGSYTISVTALDVTGTTVCSLLSYTIGSPLTAVGVTPSLVAPQPPHTSITLTALATGGTKVQYQYWLYNANASPAWSQLQGYSSSATCIWTPTTPGKYSISVTAQDGVTGAAVNTIICYTIANGPLLSAVSVTATPALPQPANTPITFTAAATGGTNVQFQFWLYNVAATPAWSQLQAYSTSATCAWLPESAGDYLLSVTALDPATNTLVNTMVWYTVNPAATLSSVTFVASPASPQAVNTPVTLTASSIGGSNVQYQFWVYNVSTGVWSQLQGYTSSPTCTWTPTTVGYYYLSVTALDGPTGNALNTTAKFLCGAPLSAVSLATSSSWQPVNAAIELTATATGGVSVQYQFWVYCVNTGVWSLLQDYSPQSSFAWTPTMAGYYYLSVTALDGPTGIAMNSTAWFLCGSLSLATSLASPQPVNTAITLTATAPGGANVQYMFWVYAVNTGVWSLLQDYSPQSSCAWLPQAAGTYVISVTAHDKTTGASVNLLSNDYVIE